MCVRSLLTCTPRSWERHLDPVTKEFEILSVLKPAGPFWVSDHVTAAPHSREASPAEKATFS